MRPMNLVVQGPELSEAQARELAGLVSTSSPKRLSGNAYRLENARNNDSVEAWCEARRVDHAWMTEGRRFADLRLLAMDMDSTLITIECIDELGGMAGKKAEIAAITAQAMRGEIDYPESLRQRVALLEGLEEKYLQAVYEQKLRLTPGAEQLIGACKRNGVKVLLVSGGFTFFTERLKARLGLDYTISNTLEISGDRLTGRLIGPIVDAQAKARKFTSVGNEVQAAKAQTVAIGDGANDLGMMAEAGLSIAFHAKPVVRAQADCALTYSDLCGVLNLFE
ncbi:MAG TPA: phosphoserine phosphatase SerB [Burkholderiales bacterium]|nr:phosphoserine phosphatase SerB [Burkholderiales bacterium]